MTDLRFLLMTDVVDSTQLAERLGDAAMAEVWARHDARARALMQEWHGTELGRTDGFLLLFAAAADAVGFALAYHRMLRALPVPLAARVGVHSGPFTLRENRPEDTARGALRFEIDGVALPVAARVTSAAIGGQTLVSGAAAALLHVRGLRIDSHGHWRLKGVDEPVELFEVGADDAPFVAPPDSAKAYRVMRRGEVWTTLHELPNNLPAERDAFIGRLEPLKQLARAFDDGARLVTVLGIGGVGKTRLALAYARAWLGDYTGGVWFCDLNAARGADGIVHAATQALELPPNHPDPVRQIGTAIAGRGPCLVILDTFEQVARHAEATIGAWLERAPEARFLVTTREVLGIVGENAVVLAPLAAEESERLFRQRVRAAGLPAALPPGDEAAIAPLMALLDHLPLAIELAAARARVLPPNVMLQRMGERFKVLARRGERHDRQNTLRATLDWSWDLLGASEQVALMHLAVFEGGVALQAAETVLGPALEDAGADAWVLDLLQALVEKSLLRTAGDQRFAMLRAVHDYAEERLEASGAAGAARQRHRQWFAALAPGQVTANRGEEAENVVVACRRAILAEPGVAVALLRNAWAVLRLTGPFSIAAELGRGVDALLAADDPQRAVVDNIRGAVATLRGDFTAARRCYAAAIERATRDGDALMTAQVRCHLAQLELSSGDADAAERLLAEVQEAPGLQGAPEIRLMGLNCLGQVHQQKARWSASRRCFTEALALAERSADRRWQGGLHGNLGLVARAEGRREDARKHWQTALRWAAEVGDQQWAGNNHCNLGLLQHELGDEAGALAELQAALDIARAIGHPRLEATVLCNLGLVEQARGDLTAASVHHARAVEVAHALGDRRLEGQARGYLGLVLAELDRCEQAHVELLRARELLEVLGDPSAMALVLLQSAIASATAGDAGSAREALGRAQACLENLEGIDTELAAMLERAQASVGRFAGA